jgi:drug/metabolite transporter (DMT)-like permease
MHYQKGIIYTLLSAATFAMTPLFVVKAYQKGATAWEIIFIQSIVASSVLFIGLLLFSPQNLKINKSELKVLAPIGLIGSLGTVICYNLSLQYIPGGIATLLLYTYPVFVTIGAVSILGQKFTSKQILALIFGSLGVILASKVMKLNGTGINNIGLLLGILAAISYTILNLLSEKALKTISVWKVTAYTQFGSTLGILGIIFFFPKLININSIKPVFWLYGGGVSIICSIIPIFLLMQGISYIGSSRASIISTVEIPLTLVLVFIFLGERFTGLQIFGSFLIFFSVLILRTEGENANSFA